MLSARSSQFVLVAATLLVPLVWLLDFVTGPRLSTSIFYLVPIMLASWCLGGLAGLIVALASATAWLVNDIQTNPTENPLIPFWNASVRLGMFLIVSSVVASLAAAKDRQQELVSFVVHDLRSPLSSMIISLQLLRDSLYNDDIAENEGLLDIGLASGEQMQLMIDALLDLARLEGGKMPLRHQKVNVHDLLAKAATQVSLNARQHQVSIELKADGNEGVVRVDPELTVRVLVNLLVNAIQHSPAKTTVTLQAVPAGQDAVLISVQDEGPGIPPEWQQKAFRKFEQLKARKSGVAVGSGLGLAFCKMAVEAQGGRIWIEPGPEKGTVVSLTVPVADGPAADKQTPLN